MSTIVTKIKDGVITAMKAKDKELVAVLKNVKGKLDSEAKTKQVEALSDTDAQKVIQKYVKERQESLKIATEAGRDDLATKEQFEIDTFTPYLPQVLSEDETKTIVQGIIDGGANNIGAVMGQLKSYGNELDKGVASKIARELL